MIRLPITAKLSPKTHTSKSPNPQDGTASPSSMSILASVIPGRLSAAPGTTSYISGATSGSDKFINPTLNLKNDDIDSLQFQQGSSAANSASTQALRFYLPKVLDAVDEVSYKISVPNFASLPPLRLGSKYITDLIRIDSMTPGDIYGPKALQKTSGLDNYYFDGEKGLGSFSRFDKTSQLDLPDRFFEEYNLTQCSTTMGLFPELRRSWIAVDNKLVLWNYTLPLSSFNKSSQFLTIDQLRHTILAVGLAKPKPGVFVADANYLLLIATTMDVHIYVVKYDNASNDMEIYNPNLSVNSHGLIVKQFITNPLTHEIFFQGEGDGINIWRLDYTNNVSFIKNKCDKVRLTKSGLSSVLPIGKITGFDLFTSDSHLSTAKPTLKPGHSSAIPETLVQMEIDSERNIMYSLSNRSVIRTYKLVPGQEQFLQHGQLAPSEVFKSLSQMIPDSANIKSFSKFRIVSIQKVTQAESSNVLLIAVTNYGNRIFLRLGASTSSAFMYGAPRSGSLKLNVVSMKFPPVKEEPKMNQELDSFTRIKQYVALMASTQQNSELLKNTKFAKILSPGIYLAVKKTKTGDRVFISSVNYGFLKNNNKVVEDAEFLNLDSKSSSVDAPSFTVHDIVQLSPSMNASNTPNGYANVLASQYTKKPLQFAVLTNYGISIFQYRTSDQIIGLLEESVLQNFIEENGYEETCSSLLYLACSSSYKTGGDLAKRKAELLFANAGNNARLVENTNGNAKNQHAAIQPSHTQPVADQVVLSDRFYGTCLLISRLFREVWSKKVFTPLPHIKLLPNGSVEVASVKEDNLLINGLGVDKSQVEFFIGSVLVLIDFFNDNLARIPGLDAPSYSSDPSKLENEACARAEHIAFTSIIRSLNSMKEALSFLMVLLEETQTQQKNPGEIFKFLTLTNQLNLLALEFKDLLLPSLEVKNLIKDLLSSIINKTILKGGSVDLIASSLQGRWGSFCSTDDVYIFKAIENLTRAKNIGNRDVELKNKCLSDAVELFEHASDSLTLENVEHSVDIMLSLDFYNGAVSFLLKLSKKINPTASTRPDVIVSTTAESNALAIRSKFEESEKKKKQFYDLIFSILGKLDIRASQVKETSNQYMINELAEVRDATYETCFASSDKAFQYDFYRWFISQGYSERLLTINTPFILPFLEEASQDNLQLTQILWLYHAKRENYLAAAKILYALSISDFKLTLRQRIESLSRANGFCNCTCPPNLRQEVIHLGNMVQDLFEVANIQLDLLNSIQADSRITPANLQLARESLNSKVLNASDLFNDYADPLGYYEICLTIFCISDYKNPDDIYKRWELYFEKIKYEYEGKNSIPFYTVLSDALVSIGQKIHNNPTVFSTELLIKMMCKNILGEDPEKKDSLSELPAGIVVQTFFRAGISYEALYFTLRSLIKQSAHDTDTKVVTFLRDSEMVFLIKAWYESDRKLRESVSRDQVVSLTSYTIQTDPIAAAVEMHHSFI